MNIVSPILLFGGGNKPTPSPFLRKGGIYFCTQCRKELLGCSRLTGLRLASAMTSSFRRQASTSARNPLFTSHPYIPYRLQPAAFQFPCSASVSFALWESFFIRASSFIASDLFSNSF